MSKIWSITDICVGIVLADIAFLGVSVMGEISEIFYFRYFILIFWYPGILIFW